MHRSSPFKIEPLKDHDADGVGIPAIGIWMVAFVPARTEILSSCIEERSTVGTTKKIV